MNAVTRNNDAYLARMVAGGMDARDAAEMLWDSERRDSPYSTVADPDGDDYCEMCDSTVDYSDGSPHGRCRCNS